MKRLYFMRHGLSELNVKGIIAGHTETPLTEEGRQQARQAGRAAKSLGIGCIVSSPLARAIETAQLVAQEIGYPIDSIVVNEILIERHFGAAEARPWVPDTDYDAVDGAETTVDIVARAYLALEWINSLEADHILVVSHGGFGRALRSILKSEYPMSHPEKLKNAEILCWVEEDGLLPKH